RSFDALLCTAASRCLASPSAVYAPTWIIQPVWVCGLVGAAAGGGLGAGAGAASATVPVVVRRGQLEKNSSMPARATGAVGAASDLAGASAAGTGAADAVRTEGLTCTVRTMTGRIGSVEPALGVA